MKLIANDYDAVAHLLAVSNAALLLLPLCRSADVT
jgi:hypothetical protein